MIYLCTHQANVCECERDDCHLLEHAHKCSKPSTNWRRTGNKEEGKKKIKENTSAEAMESAKGMGEGEQLDLFTSILQCGIGFDRVVSASNFCLKV